MRKTIKGKNDLITWCRENHKKYFIDEWDYSNNELPPESYFPKSHKLAQWICKKSHSYTARIADRTSKSSGCPYCSGRMPIIGETDLKTWCLKNDREDLICDWSDKLNEGKKMSEYSYASNKVVVWKCHICLNEWSTRVYSRTIRHDGCSKCNVSGTSFPEQFLFLVLKRIFNNASNRDKSNGYGFDLFMSEENIAIEYNGAYYHAKTARTDEKKRKYCDDKGIKLLQIYEDVKDINISGDNIICWKYSRDKNDLKELAESVLCWIGAYVKVEYNNSLVDWNRIYKDARINTYNVKYEDSLEYKSPMIAAEWDEENNDGLMPSQISNGSHDTYSWICRKCGKKFSMKINDRTRKRGAGCPECAKTKQINSWIKKRTEVKSFFSWCNENERFDLLEEWDKNKNTLSPSDYPSGSNQIVWWKCSRCGNSWPARISNRKKTGCRFCTERNRGMIVIQYKNGEKIAEYRSISLAARETKVNSKSIRNVLQGKQKTAGGFGWAKKEM